jgi:hypothetical protein
MIYSFYFNYYLFIYFAIFIDFDLKNYINLKKIQKILIKKKEL